MTTFDRFCEYVEATRKMVRPKNATYGNVVAALADAGFRGATAGELQTLARHQSGYADTRRERTELLRETITLMTQYGVAEAEFGHIALSHIIPPTDERGQTVLYDLKQFENDLREAAHRLGRPVPPMSMWNSERVADDAFAWVYALRNGMLEPLP